VRSLFRELSPANPFSRTFALLGENPPAFPQFTIRRALQAVIGPLVTAVTSAPAGYTRATLIRPRYFSSKPQRYRRMPSSSSRS
jgi:hypothetical protein